MNHIFEDDQCVTKKKDTEVASLFEEVLLSRFFFVYLSDINESFG